MQLATQPVWLILQFTPLVYIAFHGTGELTAWSGFTGAEGNRDGSIGLPQFGAAGSMLMSLLPQIGEQVDYLRFARPATGLPEGQSKIRCSICESSFERIDMAYCPVYGAPICSLCCTLEASCHDMCKPGKRLSDQITRLMDASLPQQFAAFLKTRMGQFLAVLLLFSSGIACLLTFIFFEYGARAVSEREVTGRTLWIVFLSPAPGQARSADWAGRQNT
jgi:hypothetical protein